MDSVCHILFPLLWSVVALSIVIMIFVVVFLYGVTMYLESVDVDATTVDGLTMYFCSVPMTFLSLFMSLTNGQSWWYIAEPLLRISWVYGALFVSFVTFLQFGVLNIITGIFVENAARYTRMDCDYIESQEAEQRTYIMTHLRDMFELLDIDANGSISKTEFKTWTKNSRVVAFFEHVLGLETWKINRFFDLLDVNLDGFIEKDEFIVGCMRLRGVAKNMDQEVMLHFCSTLKADMKKVRLALVGITSTLEAAGKKQSKHVNTASL